MRRLSFLTLIAIVAFMPVKAAYFEVAGVQVTDANANNILGDGSISYDYGSNTLTLNGVSQTFTASFVYVSQGDVLSGDSRPLVINCLHNNEITMDNIDWIWNNAPLTEETIPAINYEAEVVITGGGCLTLKSYGAAVSTGIFRVQNGCAVNLINHGNIEIGGDGPTLIANHLYVDNSVLNVEAGVDSYHSINTSMETANLTGVWSQHFLSHKREEKSVRERYKYAYNASQHVWEYRYRTVHKTTKYDGWYHDDYAESKDVDIYPEAYPIWVDGTNVNRYNYLDILGNGQVSYDPLTKTLTTKVDVPVESTGYLKIRNTINGAVKEFEGSSNISHVVPTAVEIPEYAPENTLTIGEGRLIFNYFVEGQGYESYEPTETGECSFAALTEGSIYFDKEQSVVTFNNAVVNDCQLILRDGDFTVELIGDNSFNSEISEDLTFYQSNVKITGTGKLEANMIYDVKCDYLTLSDGCTVDVGKTSGFGILTVDNSTLSLRGDTVVGILTGYWDVRLQNAEIKDNESVFYRNIIDAYGGSFGFLTDDGRSPMQSEVLIGPVAIATNPNEENNGNNNQNEGNQEGSNEGGSNQNGNQGENNQGSGNNTATAVNETVSGLSIYTTSNTIVVENTTDAILVYDAMGRIICSDMAHGAYTEITINRAGVYIVCIGKVSKKIFIQ